MHKVTTLHADIRWAVIGLVVFSAIFMIAFSASAQAIDTKDQEIDPSHDVILHLSKVRNISIKEAEIRIGWQNRAEVLHDQLAKEVPATSYGGMWIDKDTDRVKVGVLNDTENSESARTELAKKIANSELTAATDYIEVNHSYNRLMQTKDLLTKTFEERVGSTEWPMQFGLMPSQNKIEISIPKYTTKISKEYRLLLDEIKSKYLDMVIFKTYTEKPTHEAECNWWFCNSPLRGAVGLKNDFNSYNGIICTAGFNVIGNSGTRYIVTAGHCHDSPLTNGYATETYNYATKKIGSFHNSLLEGKADSDQSKLDAMLIKIREDTYNWDVIGMVVARGGIEGSENPDPPTYNERYDITDSGSNDGLEGARVCVSGAKSSGSSYGGGSCGAINLVDTNWHACDSNGNNCARTYKLSRAYYCSTGGDSGMPVFRLGKAHGIHRGNAGSGYCNSMKYFTGMNPIVNGFDGNISIF